MACNQVVIDSATYLTWPPLQNLGIAKANQLLIKQYCTLNSIVPTEDQYATNLELSQQSCKEMHAF